MQKPKRTIVFEPVGHSRITVEEAQAAARHVRELQELKKKRAAARKRVGKVAGASKQR